MKGEGERLAIGIENELKTRFCRRYFYNRFCPISTSDVIAAAAAARTQ